MTRTSINAQNDLPQTSDHPYTPYEPHSSLPLLPGFGQVGQQPLDLLKDPVGAGAASPQGNILGWGREGK